MRRHDPAGVGWRKIVLTEVQSGIQQQGDIRAIVHDEERAGVTAERGYSFGFFKGLARKEILVAKLNNAGAGFEDGFGSGSGSESTAGVQHGIKGRNHVHGL